MQSFWEEERKNYKEYESIRNDMRASVCVIGGGLTGLTTAYYLSKYTNVVLLERDRICSHTSGRNTGKVTSQHEVFYRYLIDSQGKEFAKKYLEANQKAIENISEIVQNEKIDCDFERENSYVFTTRETDVDVLKKEKKSIDKLEKNLCTYVTKTDLPMEIAGAIEFKNQAKIHPVKYGYGLAKGITKNNSRIFENSQVTDIKKSNGKYEIYVNKNKVTADYVVMATRYPFIKIPGYYFLKMYQSTSYAIVADVKRELFDGMYINYEVPNMSFRVIEDNGKKLLLAVGYDYKTGTEELKNGYTRLETAVRKMYPDAEVLYKWSAEDCISLDKIPYIGEFSAMMPNVYVATGFNKWGITSSNVAANIIADKILGKENEYEDLFKARRVEPIKNRVEVGNMLKEANKSILMSRFKIPKDEIDDIKIGEGKIIEIDNKKVGVYKANTGEIFKVKPICTHLGCELYFNNIDKTWECPCHGSKFSYDGKSIEVPSNKNLE